ncbi:TMEM63A [Symbiodinium natans]|uniref:TMEM63A protein n=1 Tax=Symbiodinium natans TaxID=878477 RepID=A0A812PAU7_9DINO|nr:TMEM63A [Symbiodinium natans]
MEANATKADTRQWLKDHAQPPVTVGMGQSIALNVATLVAGLAIWHLKRWCRHLRRRNSDAESPSQRLLGNDDYADYTSRNAFEFSSAFLGPTFHGTALNYLIFLRIATEMCTTLTVVSAVLVIPHWGVQPLLLGGPRGRISLAQDISADGICLLCLLATVFGVVVLMFTQRMKVHMRVRSAMHPQTMPFLNRTVWLTHLPVGDNLTGKPFSLTDQEFQMVEQSLTRAIEEHIRKKLQVSEEKAKKAVVRVHVPFVVDTWYDLDARQQETHARLKMKREELSIIQAELDRYSCLCRCIPRLRVWRLSRQVQRLERKAKDLKSDLDHMELRAKRMSGSAFVTFQDKSYKATLFEDMESCWKFYSYAYFNFGQPPFASVTLRCRRAPHPADVMWENLHIPYYKRVLRFTIAALLLLVFMLVVVTPVSVSSELNTIIPELRKGSKAIRHAVVQRLGVSLPDKRGVWRWMSLQLPTMIILFINSLLLPYIIGVICNFTRSHTLSKVEVNQMLMNYVFLVLNQLLIPLLGLTGIPALLEFLEMKITDQTQDISVLQLLDGSMFSSPGLFYVRYLLNCIFLTNTNSLLNLSQLVVRWLLSQPEPWIFAWGYWYAFTLAILTTAVSLGVLMPSLLPCGALFFAMKYRIDKHILSVRGYLCGPESQGLFIPRVLFIMRMIVAGFWLVIGSSLHFTARTFFQDRWTAPVPLKAVEWFSALLVAAALVVWLWSSWAKASSLHNDKFELLRFSKNQKEKNFMDRCLDSIFGKLQQDLEAHWQRVGQPKVDRAGRFPSEDTSLSLGSLTFARRDSTEVEEQHSDEGRCGFVWHCRSWLSSWTEFAVRRDLPADLFCVKLARVCTFDGL